MMNEQLLQSTEEVEQVVYSYLPAEEGHQQTIFEAMNYSVKAGGDVYKRKPWKCAAIWETHSGRERGTSADF